MKKILKTFIYADTWGCVYNSKHQRNNGAGCINENESNECV